MAYEFICENGHRSHSASKTQKDSSCPECGEPTKLIEKGRLQEDHSLSPKALFTLAENLKGRGYSETTVAHVLRFEVTELRAFMVEQRTLHHTELGKKFQELVNAGKSNLEVAEELNISEKQVRELLMTFGKLTPRDETP